MAQPAAAACMQKNIESWYLQKNKQKNGRTKPKWVHACSSWSKNEQRDQRNVTKKIWLAVTLAFNIHLFLSLLIPILISQPYNNIDNTSLPPRKPRHSRRLRMPMPPLLQPSPDTNTIHPRTSRILHHPLHLLNRNFENLRSALGLHLYRAAGGMRCGCRIGMGVRKGIHSRSRRRRSRIRIKRRRGIASRAQLLFGSETTGLIGSCCGFGGALLVGVCGGGEVVAGGCETHFLGDEEEEDGYEEEF